jgi:4-amino-4-deoxy-L-arabinose transferase-like glycosyltransferase
MKTDHSGQFDSRLIFSLLFLYFALHIVLRIWISHGAELDEAEQLILSQELRWGYGSQPPLFTWLLVSLSTLSGPGVLSLAVMKNLLLFTTYTFVYLSAREITQSRNAALVAMVSLLLIPQVAWESQRDLTHSVLATCCASITLFVFLRLLKTGKTRFYLLFGCMAALGMLSKYNYFIFLAALLLAAMPIKPFRRILLSPKSIFSLAIFLLVVSPHLTWVWQNQAQAFASSKKFGAKLAFNDYGAYAEGILSLGEAILAFLGPLLAAYFLFFFRKDIPGESTEAHTSLFGKFLRNYFLAILLICTVPVFLFQVTKFKDRWMQPLFFAAPIYLSALFSHRLNATRTKGLLLLCTLAGVCVLTILPLRTFEASYLDSYNRLNLPFEKLASKLQASGFRGGVIFADDHLTGGNLRLFFHGSTVVTPKFFPSLSSRPGGQELIVWDASEKSSPPSLPPDVAGLLEAYHRPLPRGCQAEYLNVPLRFSTDHFMRLGYILVNPQVSAGL